MTAQFSRRSFLSASLGLAAAGALAGCVAKDSPSVPDARPGDSATPTPSASSLAPSPPSSTRPSIAGSFGPNATHYPDDLPWLGGRAPTEVVADCDWADIARSIEGVTAEQAARGVVIRVRPGELAGGGSRSSDPPVLSSMGDLAWTRTVVICPLEGFGTVTVSSVGIRIDQCARLAFYGFLGACTFTLTQCDSVQLGWSRFDGLSITRGARDIGLYELVLGFRRGSDDTVGIRPTEVFDMTNITREGCVFGPSVKPDGSGSHSDTIQLEGTGTGPFGPFVSTDCVDYGSSNSAELLHSRLSVADYRHCMVLAGELPWRVFPLQAGDYVGSPNAFAGGCLDVRLSDSIVAGPVGRTGFTQVQNTTLSYEPAAKQQPRVSGEWLSDPSIADWSADQIMAEQAIPDYETDTLRALWVW